MKINNQVKPNKRPEIKLGDIVQIENNYYLVAKTACECFLLNINGTSTRSGVYDDIGRLRDYIRGSIYTHYPQEKYSLTLEEKADE